MSDFHQSLYQIQGQTVNELKSLIHSLSANKDNIYIKRIQELEAELRKLKKSKRYGLVWEDKPETVVEDCKQKLPVLIGDNNKTIDKNEGGPVHILIEGDNYHALSVLAYTHEKSVDVIYIDPPYNTGNKDFIYNDTFIDREDSFRHSKWLSFMSKRLELAKGLLKEDGVIFISIDDNEQAQLKLLCDEIFDSNNFIGKFIWKKTSNPNTTKSNLGIEHEYVYVYGGMPTELKKIQLNNDDLEKYTYSDEYESVKGKYKLVGLNKTGTVNDKRPNLEYDIECPDGSILKAKPRWRWSQEKFQNGIIEGRIVFKKSKSGYSVYYKQYMFEDNHGNIIARGNLINSILLDLGRTTDGTMEINKILGQGKFDFPKPTKLIKFLIDRIPNQSPIVLDFFAGSGTTGHAVLELNKEDGGKRQCILVTNNENQIAEEVTYPRMQRVIEGYADVEGIPANLRYYRTDFIAMDRSIDDLRGKFMGRCTEMLQIRENCFSVVDAVGTDEYFQIFENTETLLAILYHPYEIEKLKVFIEHTEKPVIVYIFSMGGEIFEEELAYLSSRIRIESVPDEILQTYKKIFGF